MAAMFELSQESNLNFVPKEEKDTDFVSISLGNCNKQPQENLGHSSGKGQHDLTICKVCIHHRQLRACFVLCVLQIG